MLRKLTPKHFSIEISGNIREYVKKIGQKKRNKRSASHLDEQMNDDIDYTINRNNDANTYEADQGEQQTKASNTEEYRDYAFDTTDSDRINENDDLLRRYYNHPVGRRSVNNDYDSFSDIMRLVSAQGDREDPFMKRLHYGNDDSFLNDESNDDNDNNDEFNTEYDEYDDY